MSRKTKKTKAAIQEYLPWVEKYRPRDMSEIAHQSHVISTLQKSLTTNTNNLPHLLFYGPAGTGKTSTILALCRELFGSLMKERVLELNASDERGINVVRHKIKTFAQFAVSTNNTFTTTKDNVTTKHKVPNFKIIILDEADCMTRDAQTALRRTMELYSNVTRFCLICNYVSRIIAPVASRCAKFRYQPLSMVSMKTKLTTIVANEQINVADNVLTEIINISKGDMRKCITLLQSCSLMKAKSDPLTLIDVETVCVRIPDSVVQKICDICSLATFEKISDLCEWVIAEGYPVSLILQKLVQFVIKCGTEDATDSQVMINNLGKAYVCLMIAEADKKLVDGASEFLQLMSVLTVLQQHLKPKSGQDDEKDAETQEHEMIDID